MELYRQNDGFAMSSTIRPVLAGISKVEFQTRIIPMTTGSIFHWKSYVDDTFFIYKKRLPITCFNAFEIVPYTYPVSL